MGVLIYNNEGANTKIYFIIPYSETHLTILKKRIIKSSANNSQEKKNFWRCNPLISEVMGFTPMKQVFYCVVLVTGDIFHTCTVTHVTKVKNKKRSLECVYIIYQIRLMSELSCCYLCNPCLQRGQHDIIFSHWSTHFWWNKWEQGSCLTSSLSLYLAKQMQHSCHHTHKLISSI